MQHAERIALEERGRRRDVGGQRAGERVGRAALHRVVLAEADRLGELAQRDRHTHLAGLARGRAAEHVDAASATAADAAMARIDGPAGRPTSPSLTTRVVRLRDAPGVEILREDLEREARRQRADSAGDGAQRVVGHRADVVAGRAELVGRQLGRADGVVDDRVDVRVLEKQRAAAGAVERSARRATRPSPSVYATVPIAPIAIEPEVSPTETADPGTSGCGGKPPARGEAPEVRSGQPALRAARVNIAASGGLRPDERQRRREAVAAGDDASA